MSKHTKLLHVSRMQMVDFEKFWDNADFDPIGTIIVGRKSVFHDIPHTNTTHCYSFNDILTLEYK